MTDQTPNKADDILGMIRNRQKMNSTSQPIDHMKDIQDTIRRHLDEITLLVTDYRWSRHKDAVPFQGMDSEEKKSAIMDEIAGSILEVTDEMPRLLKNRDLKQEQEQIDQSRQKLKDLINQETLKVVKE